MLPVRITPRARAGPAPDCRPSHVFLDYGVPVENAYRCAARRHHGAGKPKADLNLTVQNSNLLRP